MAKTAHRGSTAAPGRAWLAVCALLAAGLAGAQPAAPAPAPPDVLELSADPATVVLEYTQIFHMLEAPDPVPLLRVYGDGRVRVHVPVYMQGAGDYEMVLPEGELEELVSGIAASGLLEASTVREGARRGRIAARRARRSGVLHHVSDGTETVLRVRIERYRAAGAPPPAELRKRTLRWTNLQLDAREFPELATVQSLAEAERRVRRLLERPELEAVGGR